MIYEFLFSLGAENFFRSEYFVVFGLLFAAFVFIFWLCMLLHCIQGVHPSRDDRLIWLLVIVLLHGLGAAIYFFVQRPRVNP
jgi:hypothetical protein